MLAFTWRWLHPTLRTDLPSIQGRHHLFDVQEESQNYQKLADFVISIKTRGYGKILCGFQLLNLDEPKFIDFT